MSKWYKSFNPRSLHRERLKAQSADESGWCVSIHAPYIGSDP